MTSEGRGRNSCLPFRGRTTLAVRSGYTLVELMLVLAVIGTLAAVAWPSVLRMQADHDLSAAAEQVRQQVASARTRAIQSGVAYQFRFEPKGTHFTVVPFETEPEMINTTGSANTSANTVLAMHRFGGTVPKKISFHTFANAALPLTMASQKLPPTAFRGLPNAGDLANVDWSPPIIFTTEGTAMDAVVTLADKRGYAIDIVIRGLTGATAVSMMRKESLR